MGTTDTDETQNILTKKIYKKSPSYIYNKVHNINNFTHYLKTFNFMSPKYK